MSAIPTLTLRCPGRKPLRLTAGQRARLGRHGSNDVVLADDTVSRFHAVIQWDPDEDRPFVEDNGSANGIEVDGELIEGRHYLPGGNQITIGRFTIITEFSVRELADASDATDATTASSPGDGSRPAAHLGGGGSRPAGDGSRPAAHLGGDGSRLAGDGSRPAGDGSRPRRPGQPRSPEESDAFTEAEGKAAVGGQIADVQQLHRLVLDMEQQGRTGTLSLRASITVRGSIVFGQGRIMWGVYGELTGRDAVRELLQLGSAIYFFSREFRPIDAPLNLSPRHLLEREQPDATRRLSDPRLEEPTQRQPGRPPSAQEPGRKGTGKQKRKPRDEG